MCAYVPLARPTEEEEPIYLENLPITSPQVQAPRKLNIYLKEPPVTDSAKIPEAVLFREKSILKSFAEFTGKHRARFSFLIKLQASIKKETLAQLFSGYFFEIFKNTYFYRPPSMVV